jgi:hypothetical protein
VSLVGGAEERMCVFEIGVGDVRAREVCLDLRKEVLLALNDDTRK